MARYLNPLLPQLNWRHKHPLLGTQPCPPNLLLTPEEEIMVGKFAASNCSDPLQFLMFHFTIVSTTPSTLLCSLRVRPKPSPQEPRIFLTFFFFVVVVYSCDCFACHSGNPLVFSFLCQGKVNSRFMFLNHHFSILLLGIMRTL